MSLLTNIHSLASRIIPGDSFKFRKFVKNTTNDFGISVQEFEEPRNAKGHIQPGVVSSFGGSNIELKDYKELGLDWSRRYITVWLTDRGLEPCADQNGADQIIYDGKVFTILQVENWDNFNGWQRCYCVEDKSKKA